MPSTRSRPAEPPTAGFCDVALQSAWKLNNPYVCADGAENDALRAAVATARDARGRRWPLAKCHPAEAVDDACAEAANKEKCIMNVRTCATSESGDANVGNKSSEFSLEGDSAHAWNNYASKLKQVRNYGNIFLRDRNVKWNFTGI